MDGIGTNVNISANSNNKKIKVQDLKDSAPESTVIFSSNTSSRKPHIGDDFSSSNTVITLANKDGNHYNFVGDNMDIRAKNGAADRTIQMDTKNSTLDLSNTSGENFVYMSEESADNTTYLGQSSNNYIDGGDYNWVSGESASHRYETTDTSEGSIIKAGNGDDQFTIGGQYGVIDGAGGNDYFQTVGIWGENEDSSYRNIIIGGDGNDTLVDKGGYNIFFGQNGIDKYEAHGSNGIANMGFGGEDSEVEIKSSAQYTYAFSTDEAKVKDGGLSYNIYELMKKFNWDLDLFLYDPKFSEFSLHDNIDEETFLKLQALFINANSASEDE